MLLMSHGREWLKALAPIVSGQALGTVIDAAHLRVHVGEWRCKFRGVETVGEVGG